MYITTGTSRRYTVLDTSIQPGEVHYTLAETPAALGASIKLWTADGGMCLRTDATADYAHPRIDGNTVVLSDTAPAEPEPVPAEPEPTPTEPEEPTADPVADLAETVAALIYQMDADKLGGGETV